MYCVGLKRHVEATIDEVKHLQTSKGSKYQIKGHYMEGGKKHNCTSMCSKAVYEQFSGKSLGAESKFDKLSKEIAEDYEEKGKSPEEAEKIGDATAAKIGMAKYGKKGMAKKAKLGMDAEDTPSGDNPMADDPSQDGGPEELFDESVVEDEQDGGVDFMNAEDMPSGDDPTTADPASEGGPEELFDESVVQDEQDGGVDFMNAEGESVGLILIDNSGSIRAQADNYSVEDYTSPIQETIAKLAKKAHKSMKAKGMKPVAIEFGSSANMLGDLPKDYSPAGIMGGTNPTAAIKLAKSKMDGVDKVYMITDGIYAKQGFDESCKGFCSDIEVDFVMPDGKVVDYEEAAMRYRAEDSPSGDDPLSADPSGEGGPEDLFDESIVQDEQDGGVDFMNAEEPVVNDPSSFPAGSGHVIGSQTDTANYTPLHAEGVGPATEGEYEDFPRQNAAVGGYDFNAEMFEAMAVYSSGPHDMQKGMAALLAGAPSVAKGNFVAFGPKYYTVKEGVSSNKFHLFVVMKLANGDFLPANAYGRIGYSPRTWYGEVTSSESAAISAIQKKINKKAKKGYNLEFGAEGDSAPQESDPTTADPLADDPATSGGPSDTYGWTEEESEMGAFSAEFLANTEEVLCSECFEASCGGHVKRAEFSDNPGFTSTPEGDFEDLPRQNDTVGGYNFNAEGEEADSPESSPEFDPLSDNPTDYDALTASDPNMDIMESQGIVSKKTTVGGLALVLGLVAAYRYSDQISDLFSKMGKSDE